MLAKKKKRRATESRFQKREAAKKPTLVSRILSYRIWIVEISGWLLILLFLLMGWGLVYFLILYEDRAPSVVETFVADVDTVWMRQGENYGGGSRVRKHYAKLIRDEGELTCQVPLKFAPNIVPERRYEFEASISRAKCLITAAEDVTVFDLDGK